MVYHLWLFCCCRRAWLWRRTRNNAGSSERTRRWVQWSIEITIQCALRSTFTFPTSFAFSFSNAFAGALLALWNCFAFLRPGLWHSYVIIRIFFIDSPAALFYKWLWMWSLITLCIHRMILLRLPVMWKKSCSRIPFDQTIVNRRLKFLKKKHVFENNVFEKGLQDPRNWALASSGTQCKRGLIKHLPALDIAGWKKDPKKVVEY